MVTGYPEKKVNFWKVQQKPGFHFNLFIFSKYR
jgi:hypothetical protein